MSNSDDRRVAETTVNRHWISTVKLTDEKLFETMVFCRHSPRCELEQAEKQYPTRKLAKAGHLAMVKRVKEQHGTSTNT